MKFLVVDVYIHSGGRRGSERVKFLIRFEKCGTEMWVTLYHHVAVMWKEDKKVIKALKKDKVIIIEEVWP